jgi:hypothetical protein
MLKTKLTIILSILIVVFLLPKCSNNHSKKSENSESQASFLNLYESIEYVGSDACQPCHADKFEGFMHTGMGQSFAKLSPEKSASYHFPNAVYYDTIKDLYYQTHWINDKLVIQEFRIFEGDTIYSRMEEPDFIIGSGHHTNSHLLFRNGFLFQAPATFYTQKGIWDLPPGFRENNSRFGRKIEHECMSCHNALPTIDTTSYNRYFDIPLGISCERCHGPGKLHVTEKLAGKFEAHKGVYDSTIVNPAHLPWTLQVDLCQRCHLQGNAVLKPGKSFADFKPGMQLSDVFTVFMPMHENGNEFKMAAHAERFQMSKCFQVSNKGETEKFNPNLNFTCISCHDPHQSVRITNIEKFNTTCKNCHSEQSKTICTENPEKLFKAQNNCVSCHMPVSGSEDIPHVTVHDHYITKPKTAHNIIEKGKLLGLKSINEKNPNDLTLINAYISYFEKFDRNPLYLKKAEELLSKLGNSTEEKEAKIYYYYTSNNFDEILKQFKHLESNFYANPWTYYRIAKSFESSKNYEKALLYLNHAIERKPSFIPFLIDRVVVEIDLKRFTLAQMHLHEILKLDTKEERAYSQQARLYFMQNDIQAASQAAQKSLKLNPDDILSIEILKKVSEITGIKPTPLRYYESKNQVR